MEIQIEYWDCLRKTKEYPSGGFYQDTTSELIRTEPFKGETEEEIFKRFYEKNNSLRYCNGSCYKFANEADKVKYDNWYNSLNKNKKFSMFYGNGVVD